MDQHQCLELQGQHPGSPLGLGLERPDRPHAAELPQGTTGPSTYINGNLGPFGIESVTDGTSNTAAISERLMGTASYGNSAGTSTITASQTDLCCGVSSR